MSFCAAMAGSVGADLGRLLAGLDRRLFLLGVAMTVAPFPASCRLDQQLDLAGREMLAQAQLFIPQSFQAGCPVID